MPIGDDEFEPNANSESGRDPASDLTEEDKKNFQQLSFFQLKEIETKKMIDEKQIQIETSESVAISKKAAATVSANNKVDFEESLAELENVVRELDGEIKLDEAIKLFERGMKLSQDCETFIKSAEQKIEILKKQSDGTYKAEPFEQMLDNDTSDN